MRLLGLGVSLQNLFFILKLLALCVSLRLILPYEEHRNGGGAELKLPASSGPTRVRGMSGRRPLVKGRGAEANQEKTVTPTPPVSLSANLSLYIQLIIFDLLSRCQSFDI